MKSKTAATLDLDAPRIDLLKKLPYRRRQLKLSDIKKAVKAVVAARLAAERAAKEAR